MAEVLNVDVSGIGGTALNIAFYVGIFLILAVVLVLVGVWAFRYFRYNQYKCVIWANDGFGNVVQEFDDAGIFVDKKTNNKRFFMKKNRVGLEPDNIPGVGAGKKKTVYLVRTGLKNFRFIRPRMVSGSLGFSVSEEDVNWAVNAYERQKKIFNRNVLLQYMPFILLAFVSIVILIIFIYFFRQFNVLADVAEALRGAAEAFAQGQAGTVIVSGG